MNNPFFKNKGPFKIEKLLKLANLNNINNFKKSNIKDIKDLSASTKHDISFFHSKRYEILAKKTKASFCITTENLKHFLPSKCELIIVEGQGSLTNQYYAGVTLGLLHGAMPDYMLMTHDPARELDVTDYPMSSMQSVMDMHVDLMRNFKDSRFIGINLLTFKFSDEKAKKEIDKVRENYGMATTDLIRYGSNGLIEAIEEVLWLGKYFTVLNRVPNAELRGCSDVNWDG